MTHRAFVLCGFVFGLLVAGRSEAQPLVLLPDRVGIGASVAALHNGDDDIGGRGPDVTAYLDIPVVQPYRVRVDVGRFGWRFGAERASPLGLPNDVTVVRSTVSIVKIYSPRTLRNSPAGYAGAGLGVYHWTLDHQRPTRPTRTGFHVLTGIEYVMRDRRLALNWELQLHALRSPDTRLVYGPLTLQASLGLKYLF